MRPKYGFIHQKCFLPIKAANRRRKKVVNPVRERERERQTDRQRGREGGRDRERNRENM